MCWYSRKARNWSRAVRSATFLAMRLTVAELVAFGILPSSWSARILFKFFSQRKSPSLLFLQPPEDLDPAPHDADEEHPEHPTLGETAQGWLLPLSAGEKA